MTRVLIIVNDVASGPGRLTGWLVERGIEADLRIGENGTLPDTAGLAEYDGVIMLGGGLLPDEYERAPWLRRETDLVQAALDTSLPTLGVCLGGQLLAHAGGGRVAAKTGAPEKGHTLITRTAEGARDAVFGRVPAAAQFVESHVDRITALPPGAVLLASSAACENQAFRLGERAWGLQFHPEAGPDNVRRWNEAGLRELGFDKDELVKRADTADPSSRVAAAALVNAFLDVVAGS